MSDPITRTTEQFLSGAEHQIRLAMHQRLPEMSTSTLRTMKYASLSGPSVLVWVSGGPQHEVMLNKIFWLHPMTIKPEGKRLLDELAEQLREDWMLAVMREVSV